MDCILYFCRGGRHAGQGRGARAQREPGRHGADQGGDPRRAAAAGATPQGGGSRPAAGHQPDAGSRGAAHAPGRGPDRGDAEPRRHGAGAHARRSRRSLRPEGAARRPCGPPRRHAGQRGASRRATRQLPAVRRPGAGGRAARARPREPLLPQHDPRDRRQRPSGQHGAPRDRAAPRLQVVHLVLARPEADLLALPRADRECARERGRRARRADHEGARLRGARPPRRAAQSRGEPLACRRPARDRRARHDRAHAAARDRRPGPARGRPRRRAGDAARRTIHRAAARGHGRRDHQGRAARPARPAPRLGPRPLRGALPLVAGAVAEQEMRDAQPARGARPGAAARRWSSSATSWSRTSGRARSSAGISRPSVCGRRTPAW